MAEKISNAVFGSPDKPVKIGGREIPAYVLDDERHTRVLVQRGMQEALGVGQGGGRAAQPGDRLMQLVSGQRLTPFISKEILARVQNPIKFKLPTGATAYGYDGTLLPEICNAVLDARDATALAPNQLALAKRCEILVRGLAATGIIALIDEATGYQEVRDRAALQQILDTYITDEWAKWTKTFPDEFYKQLFRLRNMPYPPASTKRPSYIGHWTNDIVYSRLAPGILAQLKKVNPSRENGSRARKHFQYMTPDYGTPELRRHLENIIFLMRGCTTWSDFYRKLQRSAPKHGATIPLGLTDINDEGDI